MSRLLAAAVATVVLVPTAAVAAPKPPKPVPFALSAVWIRDGEPVVVEGRSTTHAGLVVQVRECSEPPTAPYKTVAAETAKVSRYHFRLTLTEALEPGCTVLRVKRGAFTARGGWFVVPESPVGGEDQ